MAPQGHDYSHKAEAEKQRRLVGESEATKKAAEQISTAPPPSVVPKFLTGRIPTKWKGNGGK